MTDPRSPLGDRLENLLPVEKFPPPSGFAARAQVTDPAVDQQAAADPTAWWAAQARERLLWNKPFSSVLDDSNPPFYTWFADGTINGSYNCLDRHVLAGHGDQVAFHWRGEEGEERDLSYADLLEDVQRLANALRAQGVRKGDVVGIYLPMIPEVVVAMLACARIGAPHTVVFGGFAATAVRERLEVSRAKALILADGRPDRQAGPAGPDHLGRRPAQDQVREDHAQAAARRRGGARTWRRHHPARPVGAGSAARERRAGQRRNRLNRGGHMTATESHGPPEGVAQDVEAPAAAQATIGPLTGDPAIVGVPTFVVGSVMLGLALINYAPAAGGALPIIIMATGIGQLIATVWSAALGQSAVAAVFAVFGGFWLSYAALLIGLAHGWWGVTLAATVHTVAAFLISWIVIIAVLTLASLRLPSAFTLIFVLVEVALILVLAGTVNGSAGLDKAGGIVVFAFAAVGAYVFAGSLSVATGGRPLPLGRPVIT
jgi:succinate-acetate transporter protein